MTIGLVAGAYVDRWDRRRIMLASDALRAVVVLGFLLSSKDSLWLLYALAFLQATIGTFFTPARAALLPHVVPPAGLMAANSVSQASRVVAGVIGSGLAGVLVGALGAYWPAFTLDALSFGLSFLLVVRLPSAVGNIGLSAVAAAGGIGASLLEGLRTIARSRVLSTTIAALALCMLGLGAVNVLFVPLLIDVLQVGPVWFGPAELAQSTSMILSAGMVGLLVARMRLSTIVSVGLVAVGLLVGLMGAVSDIWQVLAMGFALGWFVTPVQAAVVTMLQQGVEDSARGRTMAVLQAAMSGSSVLSTAFAGIAGDAVGVRNVFFIAGAIVVAGGAFALLGYRARGAPDALSASTA
jgi:predicted MFS family arabinose efflux permease